MGVDSLGTEVVGPEAAIWVSMPEEITRASEPEEIIAVTSPEEAMSVGIPVMMKITVQKFTKKLIRTAKQKNLNKIYISINSNLS